MGLELLDIGTPQDRRWTSGLVTDYNTRTGIARVLLDENKDQVATLFAGAFFSGLPTRLPREGDHVRLQVRSVPERGLIALVARLAGA